MFVLLEYFLDCALVILVVQNFVRSTRVVAKDLVHLLISPYLIDQKHFNDIEVIYRDHLSIPSPVIHEVRSMCYYYRCFYIHKYPLQQQSKYVHAFVFALCVCLSVCIVT